MEQEARQTANGGSRRQLRSEEYERRTGLQMNDRRDEGRIDSSRRMAADCPEARVGRRGAREGRERGGREKRPRRILGQKGAQEENEGKRQKKGGDGNKYDDTNGELKPAMQKRVTRKTKRMEEKGSRIYCKGGGGEAEPNKNPLKTEGRGGMRA